MRKASEAFTEPASATSGRTHRHSLDLPEPPTCGRSSPDMRPTAWSSHGSIRFRRDTIDDPAWRREQFPAQKLAPQRHRAPWGVPDEALLQQKIGGWTARRGYLTSVILGLAPESPCAYPPGWRRSTGLKVTGSARDPVDEAAVRLAFLGFPWQYAYYGIDPEERPSTPTGRKENAKLNQMLHGPYKKEYDPDSHTWKTVYYDPKEKYHLDPEEKYLVHRPDKVDGQRTDTVDVQIHPFAKWVDPDHAKLQAPYSIAPGAPKRKEKVIYPDQGPRPARGSERPAMEAWFARENMTSAPKAVSRSAWSPNEVREDVWGATDLGPRLPIDTEKSYGRNMYLDRSRQFAAIMQRLDELERLARLTPIEGRELRTLCMRENDELLVLHRSYEESVQDGIFVLRCRELLEDLMPVVFGCGSRNAEYTRSKSSFSMSLRHQDPRYRGIGH